MEIFAALGIFYMAGNRLFANLHHGDKPVGPRDKPGR